MPNPEMKTLTVGNNTFDIRDDRIGDLADLDTIDKSSVVDAINEAVQSGGNVPIAYDSSPSPLGTAAAGSSGAYARGDHVHAMPSAADVGAYALPAGGIPATDLAAAVQTSLGKADNAIAAPASPSDGQFLVYSSAQSAWVAQTVPAANGVSF